ncbi:unnamed protein product [Adineta ricciae]|uniref:Uncharacterized protein n=1 Tax=Adineta ricciae TaxID=249248 RepID=A0A816DI67_ADIRI|nr:unnamed protein product [Adineta ricciae]
MTPILKNQSRITSPLHLTIFEVINGLSKQHQSRETKAPGFVIKTMEAALWVCYHMNSFQECALKAVHLGDDVDTVSAIYGIHFIPVEWKDK